MELLPIGGFGEIGRNCLGVKEGDEIVILDIGLLLENYIEFTRERDYPDATPGVLIEEEAIPNIYTLSKEEREKVVAICVSHAHLDHVGAVPFLAKKFPNAKIYTTRFTAEVLKALVSDEHVELPNEIVVQEPNTTVKISKNFKLELISVVHSAPQASLIALHTPSGGFLYTNDFKIDQNRVLGDKSNFSRVKELDVKGAVIDSLYADTDGSTKPEKEVKDELYSLCKKIDKKDTVLITTFASHIARINNIRKMANKLDRKLVFLGRSLDKYSRAARKAGITTFPEAKIVRYGSNIEKFLSKVEKPEEYLFLTTGHQGEPNAALSRIFKEDMLDFKKGDKVIFSCKVIPVGINIENRKKLERRIEQKNVEIFKNIHVSGHGRKEDIKRFVDWIDPEVMVPGHADEEKKESFKKEMIKEGYDEDRITLLRNAEREVL